MPTAAEMLKWVPVKTKERIPPTKAKGTAARTSRASLKELKVIYSKKKISTRLTGTTTARRRCSSRNWSNWPANSYRTPGGSVTLSLILVSTSPTVPARSRPRTLNLIGI